MDLKRAAAKVRIYRSIVFRLANGQSRTIAKPYVHETLARELAPGTSGRFYLFSSIDHRGLQAMRADDGRAVFAYPKNNEVIGLVLLALSLVWISLSVLLVRDFSLWAAIVFVIAVLVVVVNRTLRVSAERQFAGDAGRTHAANG
jgi:hypothetical protein